MKSVTKDRHTCSNCGKRFWVAYHQTDPDEPTRSVPVSCPHCHGLARVPVASGAAVASDYWAEKDV